MTSEQSKTLLPPISSRETVRLIIAREIDATGLDHGARRPAAEVLDLGRLTKHGQESSAALPGLLWTQDCNTTELIWRRASGSVNVRKAVHAIWAVPGSGAEFAVQLVDLYPQDGRASIIAALEDMFHGDLDMSKACNPPVRIDPKVDAITHQLVVLPQTSPNGTDHWEPTDDEVQRFIYRADLEAREEFTDIRKPAEMNRRPYSGAALSPFMSVMWGQQDYIENCAFLSALIGAAASAVIRESRKTLLAEIQSMEQVFGDGSDDDETVARSISELNQQMTHAYRTVAFIENRIALCIDGLSTIQPYLPAMRVESYHQTLFHVLNAEGNRQTIERMLRRLNEIVRVQQEVLDNRLMNIKSARANQWSTTIGLASILAVPFTVIFAFFSIGTLDIDPDTNMLSWAYWPIYTFTLLGITIIVGLHLWLGRRNRKNADQPLKFTGTDLVS